MNDKESNSGADALRIEDIDGLTDEQVLKEYESRYQRKSQLSYPEMIVFTELIREMYHRRLGHYKIWAKPEA